MFGTNQQSGKSYFKQASSGKLLVTSRFYTLQGEGPYRGHPAYFIRLAKCNLSCSFCDTYFEEGEWFESSALLAEAEAIIAQFYQERFLPVPSWAQGERKTIGLVITGGEPSLQEQVIELLTLAKNKFQFQQIESNGSILLPQLPQETTLVISPKCLEQKGIAIRYLQPQGKVLERADCLKFVMAHPGDPRFSAYSEIPSWVADWARKTGRPVFISPMNLYKKEPQRAKWARDTQHNLSIHERSEINERISFWEDELLDREANQRNHEYAAEYCLKHGYILNLQLHLFANLP
ncbi:MAG: 7-carboxy-7-deazaguanine synthase QueE [Legionella sp.]|nr:7-carboxy-7-deazaguanine synthase QueE [Legionella sp.]